MVCKSCGLGASSSFAARRQTANDTWSHAALAIGEVSAGMSRFLITHGQFSMIDAIRHVLEACGPSRVSLWTGRVGVYDIQYLLRLPITEGLLVLDVAMMRRSLDGHSHTLALDNAISAWRDRHGPRSLSSLRTHAKMATVEGNGLKILVRGSPSMNHNTRFEQIDITEGGPDFDLVRRLEKGLPKDVTEAQTEQVWDGDLSQTCSWRKRFGTPRQP